MAVGEVTSQLSQLTIQLTLRQKIIDTQQGDPYFVEKFCEVQSEQDREFLVYSNNGLYYQRRLCVPAEAHSSPFTIHPEGTKMYQDLKRYYWWHNMKKEVVGFVS